jgi:hypothetical protein
VDNGIAAGRVTVVAGRQIDEHVAVANRHALDLSRA